MPGLLSYFFKVIWQSFTLLWTLLKLAFTTEMPTILLMQNPPSIPCMPICLVFCVLTGTKFVIDWHNYGYTILAMAREKKLADPLVRIAKFVEKLFARMAHAHFCVTQAMRVNLALDWNVEARLLYDRAPTHFGDVSDWHKHDLFLKLGQKYPIFAKDPINNENETSFTVLQDDDETIEWIEDRPAILVSSTSWTADEDFQILLNALQDYEDSWTNEYPDLICVITGKDNFLHKYIKYFEVV